jgi:hypothetical protein
MEPFSRLSLQFVGQPGPGLSSAELTSAKIDSA